MHLSRLALVMLMYAVLTIAGLSDVESARVHCHFFQAMPRWSRIELGNFWKSRLNDVGGFPGLPKCFSLFKVSNRVRQYP